MSQGSTASADSAAPLPSLTVRLWLRLAPLAEGFGRSCPGSRSTGVRLKRSVRFPQRRALPFPAPDGQVVPVARAWRSHHASRASQSPLLVRAAVSATVLLAAARACQHCGIRGTGCKRDRILPGVSFVPLRGAGSPGSRAPECIGKLASEWRFVRLAGLLAALLGPGVARTDARWASREHRVSCGHCLLLARRVSPEA